MTPWLRVLTPPERAALAHWQRRRAAWLLTQPERHDWWRYATWAP